MLPLALTHGKACQAPLIRAFMDGVGPEGLCRIMEHEALRKATVTIAIGLQVGTQTEFFEASRSGVHTSEPRGERRFSWDRIFVPEDPDPANEKTYAEMGMDKKNALSARSLVAQQMWTKFQEIISMPADASYYGRPLFDEERRTELDNRWKMLTKRLDALYADKYRALSKYERDILDERIEEYEQERKTIEDTLARNQR